MIPLVTASRSISPAFQCKQHGPKTFYIALAAPRFARSRGTFDAWHLGRSFVDFSCTQYTTASVLVGNSRRLHIDLTSCASGMACRVWYQSLLTS